MKYQDLTKRGFSPRASSLIAFLILGLLTAPQSRGQLLQGTIDGNVTDASQAAVVNAQVRATNQETNFSRETVTNNAGGYTLPNMPPGTYSITVGSQGFQTQTLTGVAVTSGNITRRDVALGLGTVTETVTVGAQVAALQTDRADVRSEISTNAVANLPVPVGRNYQMLVTTFPGVSPPQNANSYTANPTRTVQFSVNGNFTTVNNTRIDGTSAYNVTAPQAAMYGPTLEAIEAVSIVTNSFDAEQGTAGGGSVNVTVKSGTNALHGSLFEDHTDQHLKAYPWAANRTQPKSKYIFNQYGATLGGPIKKDKLFYFVSWEGTRFVAAPPILLQVPTAAMKGGNLSASPTPIYDPGTGNANGTGRLPFQGNIIPANRIDSGIKALIATGGWTDPNQKGTGAFGLGQDLLASASGGQHRDQIDSKVSWNPTSKLSMFVRFGFNNNNYFNPQPFGILGGPSLTSANTAIGNGFGHIFNDTVSGTYVFTPHLLMDAYIGYSRNDNSSRPLNLDQNYGETLLHIPGLSNAGLTGWAQQRQNGMPQFNIDGFANVGGIPSVFQPQDYSDAEHEYVANVNWLKGTHDFRGGFDWDRQGVNEWQTQGSGTGSTYITGAGGFHFTQGTTQLSGGPAGNDFNAFASFLLGLPANAGRVYVFPDEIRLHAQSVGFYLRDRWQVSPKLTLSYGLRWEYIPMPNRGSPRGTEYFDLQNNVEVICGLDNVPEDCGITRDRQRFIPRVGIAYRISDSMVIRAGFGLANDPTTNLQGFRLDAPYVYSQLINPPNSFSFATTLRQGLPVAAARITPVCMWMQNGPNLASCCWPGTTAAFAPPTAMSKKGRARNAFTELLSRSDTRPDDHMASRPVQFDSLEI
jgi:hypothetical protein